jgi:hypothetical protein
MGERKMKSASLLVILFFSITLVTFASIMVEAVAAEDPVIVGKWDRTDGVDVYTIYANHVTETVIEGQTYHGTWEYDGSGGYKYIFHWEHSPPGKSPFIDYVTVAADGQSYSGVNNYGDNFHCVRIGDAPAAESGSFPIVVGGCIAAAAVIGAAAYWHFSAGKTPTSQPRRRFSLSSRGGKARANSGKADTFKSDAKQAYDDFMKNNPKRAPFVKIAETNTLLTADPSGKIPINQRINPSGKLPIFEVEKPKEWTMGNVNTGWGDSVQVVPTSLDPSAPAKLQGSKQQIKVHRSKPPEPSQSGQTQTSGESTGSGTGSESSGSGSSSE